MKPVNILPVELERLKLEPTIATYTGEKIFSYMNGAGEIYRMYNYRTLYVAKYHGPQDVELLVEIFDMGISEDAYGVFTHSFHGKKIKLGQGGFKRPGTLCFWKWKYYVCISSGGKTPIPVKNLLKLAQIIANNINQVGKKPALVTILPEEGLLRDSIRYFHDRNALNYHYFLSTENILYLDKTTNVVFAQYKAGRGKMNLLIVKYRDKNKANKVWEKFRDEYVPELGEKIAVKLENNTWITAEQKSCYMVIVLESGTRKQSLDLLRNTLRKLDVKNHEN